MKLTGQIIDTSIDFITGQPKVTLSLNEKTEFLNGFDDLKDREKLSIEIKPYRAKRSLDANAYAWLLIDRLAEHMGVSKEDVYRNAIKEIGGNCELICVRSAAVDKLCSGWANHGIGWISDTMSSRLKGCTNVLLYYGSSTYDSRQMSRLIDNIVQDCRAVGIETKSPDEIEKLKESWGD